MPTIRVVVRFRPINSREKKTAEENNWGGKKICPLYVDERHLLQFDGSDVKDDEKIGKQVRCVQENVPSKMHPKFAFDEILIWVSQETAYQRIGYPVVMDALNGINGTIFAYGQTGSGKTFSMFGPEPLSSTNPQLMGVIPRCCAELLEKLSSDPNVTQYRIDVAFFEIYIHNTIRDLLHPAKKGDPPLKVRDGLKGVFIENLKSETASNLEEILSLIALANSHRTVSSTKMNATSSRSHSVMRVMMRIERKDGSRSKSQINFGDLAGSEKVNKTGATGKTLREAQAINQSLTMLGNVISALSKIGSGKKKAGSMVPFRDSALTHVLKDSLSGNCKTTLVIAASPHRFNIVETTSTFRFGSRCKLVKTKAEKNVVLSPAQMRKMIASLKREIKDLKMQVLKGGGGAGGSAMTSGIGVKITWPNDFQPWPKDKPTVYKALEKQVNKQIKNILETSVANNSGDVENMPYVVSLSEPGKARKVVIQFHFDEDDEDDEHGYDREQCIALSKKLQHEIGKVNKNSLEPALKNYKRCKHFSEASLSELKQVIDGQKHEITVLNDKLENCEDDLLDKQRHIDNLEQNQQNHSSQLSTIVHASAPTQMSVDNGPMVTLPMRLSTLSIESSSPNSLRVSELLSQLLHSKYEVLRNKRNLQLLEVRYASEQKKMQQLRYIISRMQSEFMDLKATSLISKAVLSVAADNVTAASSDGLPQSLSLQSKFSIASARLGDEDNQFIEAALGDIMSGMDDKKSNRQAATPKLIRKLSALNGINAETQRRGSFSRKRANSHGKQRRFSADQSGGQRRTSGSTKKSALDHYNYGKKINKNNLNKQIFGKNKKAQQFGKASAHYLQKRSTKKQVFDDDHGSDEKGMDPNVNFVDTDTYWTGYDKAWINKWSVTDVCQWLKQVYGGRMRKYQKHFKKRKIDGKRLLGLTMPELIDLHLIRSEALNLLSFTNSIAISNDGSEGDDFAGFFDDLDDFDEFFDSEEDIDDFFDDDLHEFNHAHNHSQNEDDMEHMHINHQITSEHMRFYDDQTLRLTDLMIEQFTFEEITQIQKVPLFKSNNYNDCVNFGRIKEYYHDYSQVLLLRVYGLLCNKIGLLNISEWNALLAESQKKKSIGDDQKDKKAGNEYFEDYMVIINSFVDVHSIYSDYSDYITGTLTTQGSKYFVAGVRQIENEYDDLRDDEDAVQFFCGLRIDEMEKIMMRLPKQLWQLVNDVLEIEFVYREIIALCGKHANITPMKLQKCIMDDIGAQFVDPDMIKHSIKEMNLIPNPTITLDIWIKKLFIKQMNDESGHALESVLDELCRLSAMFELEYYKQQRLELMAKESIGSQTDYDNLDTLTFDDENPLSAGGSYDFGSSSDEDYSDYNHDEEKEISWIDNYLDLHKLLFDVGQFGTQGACQFNKLPKEHFEASSVFNNKKDLSAKRCKLYSKYGWTGDYTQKNNNLHWIQCDLGKITTVFAVAIQGKSDKNEYITKGVLTVSNTGDEWRKVQLSGDSKGKLSCSDNQTVKVYMFARYIKARYVRLNIYEYNGAPSVRWDLLFGDLKIDIDNVNSL